MPAAGLKAGVAACVRLMVNVAIMVALPVNVPVHVLVPVQPSVPDHPAKVLPLLGVAVQAPIVELARYELLEQFDPLIVPVPLPAVDVVSVYEVPEVLNVAMSVAFPDKKPSHAPSLEGQETGDCIGPNVPDHPAKVLPPAGVATQFPIRTLMGEIPEEQPAPMIVPDPVPAVETVKVNSGAALNVAVNVQVVVSKNVTVPVPDCPHPFQPIKPSPLVGVAVQAPMVVSLT